MAQVDQARSESELRREVAELLHFGPRRGVPRLLERSLARIHEPSVRTHLATLVRALCAQNDVWRGEFKRRASGEKRCDARLREVIADALREENSSRVPGERVTVPDVLRRTRAAESTGVLTIDDKEELGFGPASKFFLAKLHTLRRQGTPVDLAVHVKCEIVYPHGLAMLAAWAERFAARVQLAADNPGVARYLDATGYRQVVEEMVTIDAPRWDGEHHVAITRVEREEQAKADEVARRVVDLFERHLSIDPQRDALTIVFAELIENVYRHARSNVGAYVMAQAFPTARRLHVVVADTGIGIYAGFRESDLIEVRARATDERAAIDMALEKLVTSKSSRHKGYGLFVVRELVRRNGGRMRLTSGRWTKEFSGEHGTRRRTRSSEATWAEHLPWNGTEVSLIFDLDGPLPLTEVYRDLGPPDHREDFFG